MNRTQKVAEVEKLTDRFSSVSATIFTSFRGLTVAQMTALRSKMRGAGGSLRVVKNRLAKRALSGAKIGGVEGYFTGPTAVASSDGDAAALAKILVEFAKDNEKLKLKGGYVEGKAVSFDAIKALATLPSREVLLAMLMGSLKAPASQFVNVLSAVPRKLVMTIKALEEKKK